jgi:hypothetical protein
LRPALEAEKASKDGKNLGVGKLIPAGTQDLGEDAVFVPQAAVSILDEDFALWHGHALRSRKQNKDPETGQVGGSVTFRFGKSESQG